MNRLDDIQARKLLERFLDGATSIAEENRLYSYFAQTQLPADMQPYREMMEWYAGLRPAQHPATTGRKRFILRRFRVAAAAVIAAAAVTVALPLYRSYEQRQSLYATYEGSYVIRNGVKYSNISSIISDLQASEEYVSAITDTYSGDIAYDEITRAIADEDVRRMILEHFN